MSLEAVTLPPAAPPPNHLQRWIILILGVFGVACGIFALISMWRAGAHRGPLPEQLEDTIFLVNSIAMMCIAWLIALRAGRNVANAAMALAIMAIYLNGALGEALQALGHVNDGLARTINAFTFFAAATLFVRASQRFPVAITDGRIDTSATVWGRFKVTRTTLRALLRPMLLCLTIGALTMSDEFGPAALSAVARLLIILLGVVYFYLNYKAGDADERRKVLWFLAWATFTAVTAVVVIAIRAALGPGAFPRLRTVLGVAISALENVGQLVCFTAAVFYAGAISPSLVIRKTMVFGLTTALLLFVFATVEVFVHHEIVHLLEVTDTFASSLVGGVFGLAFHPVKHYFEHLLAAFLGRHGKVSPAESGSHISPATP